LATSASFILAAADPTGPPAALLAPATAARGWMEVLEPGQAREAIGGVHGIGNGRGGGRGATLAAGATSGWLPWFAAACLYVLYH
jgi:hypothetical protein